MIENILIRCEKAIRFTGGALFAVLCLLLICISDISVLAITNDELLDFEYDVDHTYYIRLVNGNVVTGLLTEINQDGEGAFVKISSVFGRAKIYAKELAWISRSEESYRHRHRGFLLPTAQPIRGDHFIALIEGVMPYFGFGIGEWASITGGRTLVPGIRWSEQASIINAKVTVAEDDNGLVEEGHQYYAVGVNAGWLNDYNFIGHIYGVATFTGKRTQVSTMLFGKIAGEDVYTFSAGTFINPLRFALTNGTIGISLGLDTRFPEMQDLHFIAELWNADITRPSNTILYSGLRLTTTAVAMDFGFTLTPGPALVPTVAFAWTPF